MESEREKAAARRRAQGLANQVQRSVAAIELCVDGLPARIRILVLNAALRSQLDQLRHREEMDAILRHP
jgi:hypothetical protein